MFDRKHGSKESIPREAQTSKLMDGNTKNNDGGKPEKFNYLSPLKNILRSKTKRNKTPKPDLIREAAVAAVETTMASLVQPPPPPPPASSSFSFLNSSSLNNNQSQMSAAKTETSKVLKIKKREKTSKMSESNIHEIKSKY